MPFSVRFVFRVLPAVVFYTDNGLADWQGGVSNGPVIRLRQKYFNDDGILAYELTHVRQWYRTIFIHPILYKISAHYRLSSEVEAYKEQLKQYGDDRSEQFSQFIADMYGIKISKADALQLLIG